MEDFPEGKGAGQVTGFDEPTHLRSTWDSEEERTDTREAAPDSTEEECSHLGTVLGTSSTSGANQKV